MMVRNEAETLVTADVLHQGQAYFLKLKLHSVAEGRPWYHKVAANHLYAFVNQAEVLQDD